MRKIQIVWRYKVKVANRRKLRIAKILQEGCSTLIQKYKKTKNKTIIATLCTFDSVKCESAASNHYIKSRVKYLRELKRMKMNNRKETDRKSMLSSKVLLANKNQEFVYMPTEEQVSKIVLEAVEKS